MTKNYVEHLSNEDMRSLCEIHGAKYLRELYKKNTKAFNKLRPGFRPGTSEHLSVPTGTATRNGVALNNGLNGSHEPEYSY